MKRYKRLKEPLFHSLPLLLSRKSFNILFSHSGHSSYLFSSKSSVNFLHNKHLGHLFSRHSKCFCHVLLLNIVHVTELSSIHTLSTDLLCYSVKIVVESVFSSLS